MSDTVSDQEGNSLNNQRREPINGKAQLMIQQLRDTKTGQHNILIYPDLQTLNEVMASHCRTAIEERIELALIVTHCQSIHHVREALSSGGLDVVHYEKEGSLIITDSVSEYHQTSSDGVYAMTGLINMLFERVKQMGKNGVFVVADMCSFFLHEKIGDLLDYESGLPAGWNNMNLRAFCLYHEGDFESFGPEDMRLVLDHHYKIIKPLKLNRFYP